MFRNYNLVAVIGPTASGKTAFAAQLAYHLKGEVISADSRQIYRQMNLGTGKDYDDYRVMNTLVPCHLIDIADPGYHYSVYEYQRDFYRVYDNLTRSRKFPVLCGGSGMYIEAATRGYRLVNVPRNDALRAELASRSLAQLAAILATLKKLHNTTDTDTREHALRAIEIARYHDEHPESAEEAPVIRPLYIGISYERNEERSRITHRLEKRLQQGLVEEVENLLRMGMSPQALSYYGLEYRYITAFLLGETDYKTMFALLNTAIHQFAKRQRTWFRKMEREGCTIHWLDGHMSHQEKIGIIRRLLEEP
jgi:tRNA dimethylallyltransferase